MGLFDGLKSMFGGGQKPEEKKPTAAEKAAASAAVSDLNYYNQTYLPLEAENVERLRDDGLRGFRRAVLSSRAAADAQLARSAALTQSRQLAMSSGLGLRSGAATTSRTDIAASTGVSRALGKVGAYAEEQQMHDLDAMNAIRLGRGFSHLTNASLADRARAHNYMDTARIENRMLEDQAKSNAMSQVANSLFAAGAATYGAYKEAGDTEMSGRYLSPVGKWFRSRMDTRYVPTSTTLRSQSEGLTTAPSGASYIQPILPAGEMYT